MMLFFKAASWLALVSLCSAGAIPHDAAPALVERQATTTRVPDSACTNGPLTRNCWSDGFSISTDFDAKSPPAGITRTYNLEITNTTLNPDGHGPKLAMLINKQFPGPTIIANWGDTLVIHVKNSLQHNGTGIHWHGIRQLNSVQADGVPGITECPIAPGETKTYVFKATQFGTTWYHSHWSAQYGEGVVGTMIINGPATANYDVDLGTLPITDWYYKPLFELNEQAQHSTTGPPPANNLLVNGSHVNANGGGNYTKINVTKGKKYRIRLINTSVDTTFHVSMDGHPFTVITSDFVPIKSFVAKQLVINIGQRYDVIINANQTVGNYWFRVGIGSCSRNDITTAGVPVGAILHYDGADNANPTSTTDVTLSTSCDDETNLVPFVPNTVPQDALPPADRLDVGFFTGEANLFRWTIDGTTHVVNWQHPTLEKALAGDTNYGNNSNVREMDTANKWYVWWIQNTAVIPLAHPIHLHGHDYYILGRGNNVWDGSTAGLNFNNPTRRDTAMLPGGGYLLIAFPADNPGTWVMHCHIAFHASQGLSMQFVERKGEIKGAIGDTSDFKSGCASWNTYWDSPARIWNMTDSGI